MIKKYSKEKECLKLTAYAKDVSENLSLNGHEIDSLDILDALASCGLTLQVSEENLASTAYFEMLSVDAGANWFMLLDES